MTICNIRDFSEWKSMRTGEDGSALQPASVQLREALRRRYDPSRNSPPCNSTTSPTLSPHQQPAHACD